MKRKYLLFTILSFVCFTTLSAQKNKNKQTQEVVPELSFEQRLYDEMIFNTAKIMFIDSIVVDKAEFISNIMLSNETGHVLSDGNIISYLNEFGDWQIISMNDNTDARHLYSVNRYGNEWSEPRLIEEVEKGLRQLNYPFIMADGVTLYFSAESDECLGGKDLYMTKYNAEDSEFYAPENLGLPFSSPANDYMLAISDFDNLGWLVTDRRQPEDKVCIYIFEPRAQRENFSEDTERDVLMKYADIHSIKDTWQFGDRTAAMDRLTMLQDRLIRKHDSKRIKFIVNDDIVYTSISQFKSKNGAELYQQVLASREKIKTNESLLSLLRKNYAEASTIKKHEYGIQILEIENEQQSLYDFITKTEKELRNNELSTNL